MVTGLGILTTAVNRVISAIYARHTKELASEVKKRVRVQGLKMEESVQVAT